MTVKLRLTGRPDEVTRILHALSTVLDVTPTAAPIRSVAGVLYYAEIGLGDRPVDSDREALQDFYRSYLECCNDRRFEQLDEFVDPEVQINGTTASLDQYVAGLRAMLEPFPNYHWELSHLLIDGNWLSAHFNDTGVLAATGRVVPTQEFAIYRIENKGIAEVWGAWINAL